jgi:hypothetical protein
VKPATLATLLVGVVAAVGCGSTSESGPPDRPSQAELDRRDTRAIQRQVNNRVEDRTRVTASGIVDADTTCTKTTGTAYKCVTSFYEPPLPDLLTDVTCGRSGGSCIIETRF